MTTTTKKEVTFAKGGVSKERVCYKQGYSFSFSIILIY